MASRRGPKVADGEAILQGPDREISLLVARDELTILRSRYAPGQQVAGRHVHNEHTDAFYVLEGALTFELGAEAAQISVGAGGFVAVPPGVAHALRTGDRPARWLTIHSPDGGFAAFMRGIRDGVEVEWDFWPVPVDGGLPADRAIVRASGEPLKS
jgi:quercetin dioxygenase-like cupin family protein